MKLQDSINLVKDKVKGSKMTGIDFEKLWNEPKTISQAQLKENKKCNVFFCNFMGGVHDTKENLEMVAKSLNVKIKFDYVKMLARISKEEIGC